jgi:hypothetical protein
LRKRSNHRANHNLKNWSLKNWLHGLKKLWKSLIKSLKVFFTADLGGSPSKRSPRSQYHEDLNGQSHLSSEPPILNSRPANFLLGLDNIDNLEFLTTKELIEQIEWNAESQEVLIAKEEDLTLLEDLLVNFPDS